MHTGLIFTTMDAMHPGEMVLTLTSLFSAMENTRKETDETNRNCKEYDHVTDPGFYGITNRMQERRTPCKDHGKREEREQNGD